MPQQPAGPPGACQHCCSTCHGRARIIISALPAPLLCLCCHRRNVQAVTSASDMGVRATCVQTSPCFTTTSKCMGFVSACPAWRPPLHRQHTSMHSEPPRQLALYTLSNVPSSGCAGSGSSPQSVLASTKTWPPAATVMKGTRSQLRCNSSVSLPAGSAASAMLRAVPIGAAGAVSGLAADGSPYSAAAMSFRPHLLRRSCRRHVSFAVRIPEHEQKARAEHERRQLACGKQWLRWSNGGLVDVTCICCGRFDENVRGCIEETLLCWLRDGLPAPVAVISAHGCPRAAEACNSVTSVRGLVCCSGWTSAPVLAASETQSCAELRRSLSW